MDILNLIYFIAHIVSEWSLFNANSTIFQLYHGERTIYFTQYLYNILYINTVCHIYIQNPFYSEYIKIYCD